MRFDVGLLDRLFGERVTIEVPMDDVSTREVRVTKRWLEKMQREGKAQRVDDTYVTAHIVGPDGYQKTTLKIGEDIPREQYDKLLDRETNALYALTVYEDGVPTTNVIPKHLWDQAKAQMDAIDGAI